MRRLLTYFEKWSDNILHLLIFIYDQYQSISLLCTRPHLFDCCFQVCEVLGADGLMYQDVDDLIDVGKSMNSSIERFDAACFDGHYCTGWLAGGA